VDLQSRIKGAEASLQRAKLDLQAAKQEYKVALTQAALAQSSYDKDLEVYQAKGISSLAYEKSKAEMLTAKAQVEIAKSKIASAEARLPEVNETIKGLQQRLKQMTITSPIDGFVIERNAEPGQSVPPAFTLVKIVDPQTLWAKAWVDERISGKVKVGQRAAITLRSREDAPLDGVVRRIAAVSDPVTEEREVDVGFVKIPKPFYINEQVEVSIAIETFDGLYKVPLHLLVQYKGEKGVWIDQNGKAHFLKLTIIAEDGDYAGVEKGLTEETKILLPDSKKKPLFEGSSIRS
jgi:multidrug efflux pump subunit AcrA (membrane-fusion protein)